MTVPQNQKSSGLDGDPFESTNWSMIGRLDTPDFAAALSSLCQQYWYPVYAFIRRRVRDSHHAEDLTQGFFGKVIAKQTFRMATPERGRFRSFLLTSAKNYVATELATEQTLRRGGHQKVLSLDFVIADQVYARNQSSGAAPEQDFDRAWALAILERTIERLRREYTSQDQTERFELLSPCLRSEPLNYDTIATALAISVVTARKAASRFRARYGELLREEIAGTLTEQEDLDEEIAWMIGVLGTG